MNFSEKVYYVRKKLGITQEELAKELGMSFAAINRWEQGVIPTSKSIGLFEDYCKKNNVTFEENNILGFSIITATMIVNWIENNKSEAIAYLPVLLKNLAVESGCDPETVRFPSGNQVYNSGFDGYITGSFGHKFVPDGNSVWEIGCQKNAKKKINDDYNKRTRENNLDFRKEHTLVLVSSKIKPTNIKNKLWCDSKSDGWKKVVIFDPIDLENWLSYCIFTSITFFARIQNVSNFYVDSVETAWNKLSACTHPTMTTSLFTKARDNEIDIFKHKIELNQSIVISSKSLEDALGFVLSVIKENVEITNTRFIIVEEKWIELLNNNLENKCFIVKNPEKDFLSMNGNSCISLVCGFKNEDISLDYRNISTIKEVLIKDMGINETNVKKIIGPDNVSISTIMYQFKSDSYVKNMKWDESRIIKVLPILIMERIDFNSPQDIFLLNNICKSNCEDIKQAIIELEFMEENPFYGYKDIFKIHNKKLLWMYFRKPLEEYFTRVLEIFKSYFLDSVKLSQIHIKALFDTLILYAIYNDKQAIIDDTIQDILFSSSKNVLDYAIDFAELSPLEYLGYIYSLINTSKIDIIFSDTLERRFYNKSDYNNILFSLERILYMNEFRTKAFDCLVTIFDKNYEYATNDSPKEIIKNYLMFYNNKSPFSFEEKKSCIKSLLDFETDKRVDLVVDILLKHDFWHIDITPSRREYEIPDLQIFNINKLYLDWIKIILNKKDSVDIIIKLLDNYYALPKETIQYICDYIIYNEKYQGDLKLYYYLFEQIYYLNKIPKKRDDILKEIYTSVLNVITPRCLIDKYSFLFINSKYEGCHDISTIDDNLVEEEKKSENLRMSKLKELYIQFSYKEILSKYAKIIANDYNILLPFLDVFNKDEEVLFMFIELMNNHKYALCSYILNLKKNVIIDYINSMDDEAFGDNIQMLYEIDSSLLGVVNFRNEDNVKKVFENRWVSVPYSEYEYTMMKKYNPNCFLRLINYDENFKVWNPDEVIEVLLELSDEQVRTIKDYLIKETIDKLENLCFNMNLLKVEVKYSHLYGFDKLPKKLIRYFYLKPQTLIDILLTSYEDELWEFKTRLMYSFAMPDDFYLDSINYNNFKNAFLTYKNSQDGDYLIGHLGEIYGRSADIRKNNEASLFAREEIELIHNDKFNTGYYVGLSNTFGGRYLDDGSSIKKEIVGIDELLKQLLNYPECSKILKMFKATLNKEVEMNRKLYLEEKRLL